MYVALFCLFMPRFVRRFICQYVLLCFCMLICGLVSFRMLLSDTVHRDCLKDICFSQTNFNSYIFHHMVNTIIRCLPYGYVEEVYILTILYFNYKCISNGSSTQVGSYIQNVVTLVEVIKHLYSSAR
jgi:hypothetical protein